jgi:hypothetical protein
VSGSRALQLTSSGRAGLSETFQIEINNEGVPTRAMNGIFESEDATWRSPLPA